MQKKYSLAISNALIIALWFITIALCFGIITLASTTLHWPLIGDPPVYHYIGWLMTKGYVPYKDIFDFCLFGTYAFHYFVVKFIGEGDLAWRICDLACLGLIDTAILLYCSRFSRLSGIGAAALFSALHLYNGPLCSGQKDYVMLVFLAWGLYFFQRYREYDHIPIYFFLAGLLLGAGVTMKPFMAFWCVGLLLLTVCYDYAQRRHSIIYYSIYSICCCLPSLLGMFLLWQKGGLEAFFDILVNYIGPLYPKMQLHNIFLLLREPVLGIPMGVIFIIVFLIGAVDIMIGQHKNTYRILLIIGMCYGTIHYAAQQKGLLYHLYPLSFFSLQLIASWLSYIRIQRPLVIRIATVGFALWFIVGVAHLSIKSAFRKPYHYFDHYPSEEMKMHDLSGRVPEHETIQSMDIMSGTINICLRLHIFQATRFLNDAFFYFEYTHPYVQKLRNEFLRDLDKKKPLFIIMSRGGFPIEGYDRIKHFPELDAWLHEHYVLDREREIYRLYKRKG